MATVKYAVSAYTADGVTTDYLITWDYLDEDHIAVYVDGTSNADPQANHTFTKLNNTTLRITDGVGGAIVSGAEIEIRRETPLLTRAITFADGSALLAEDLNKNSDYLLYSMQEVLDTVDAAAQDGALAAEVATEALRDETEGFKNETLAARNTTQGYLATVQSDAADADNHRIAAGASEVATATSEANSATSATNSANSATASANSATASAASAAASLASEQASAASETAAAASETAAAASETAAAASEAAAATSEANAEAAFDNFDDRYLGSKATAPTVDNDGDALQTGALYWNSTNDTMYVWNGASWDTLNSTTGLADGAASTVITIDAANKVGINTGSPARTLDVTDQTNDGSGGLKIANYLPVLELDDISGGGTSFTIEHDQTNTTLKHGNNLRLGIEDDGKILSQYRGFHAGNYSSFSTTTSGAMTILGHNAHADQSTPNTVKQTNSGYYGHFLRMYYNDGISMYVSPNAGQEGDVLYNTSGTGTARQALKIHTNGAVNLPYQPAWSLRPNWSGNTSVSGSNKVNFSTTAGGTRSFVQNVSVSSGRVTVPTAGKYFVEASFRQENTETYYQISLVVNGSQVARSGIWYSSQRYENVHVLRVLDLNANDYIECHLSFNGNMAGYNDSLTFFEGFLIG